MGINIYLDISRSVTKKEWADVYQETVQLIEHFPLAESRKIDIHGVKTVCLVKTQDREIDFGRVRRYGWAADGDMKYMKTAEEYFLPRDLISDESFDPGAGDAILGALSAYLDYDAYEAYLANVYEIWGAKTQAEPYHIHLLAAACLIESRLGRKAFIYGDITRGQCRKAVEIANEYLEDPIEMPDRCYEDRLFKRVEALDLTDTEKVKVFEQFFMGTKDAAFGDFLRRSYSEENLAAYWKDKFKFPVGTVGFDSKVSDYLLWGFDIEKLCSYVNFKDKDGNMLYEQFVTRIMDAKLHLKDKNCVDHLKIDPEEERPYSIWTLFAQVGFAGARNKKVDRYVPIEDIRAALKKGLSGKFDADPVIDAYLEKESRQTAIDLRDKEEVTEEDIKAAVDQDAAEVFDQFMEGKRESLKETYEKYDINDYDILQFYEDGDSIYPELAESVGKSRKFLDTLLDESHYKELAGKSAKEKLEWLAATNQYIMIRESDWEKVYQNLAEDPDSFARYYPLMRARAGSDSLNDMLRALMINDEFYRYSKQLADNLSDESET